MPSPSVGLATKTGLAAAAGQFLTALLLVLLQGDHTTETVTALVTATVTLVTVLSGRYAQAAAAHRKG